MSIEQGGLENIILNAIWFLEENNDFDNDVTKIQKEINSKDNKWAYTTVKTILDRLVEKGIVFRYKQSRKFYYRAQQSRITAGEAAIQKLIKQYFNDNIIEFKDTAEKIYSEALVLSR